MATQFIPCPACGAVGEVGTKCLFCSTIITLKEGEVSYSERIPQRRTVNPQRYAEKISIYHNVKPIGYGENLLIVSIGDQHGLVNLNGDIIYPLGDEEIKRVSSDTIGLGNTYEETLREAATYWDNLAKEWKHEEAIKCERFNIRRYFNLYTGTYADKFGFVEDKENPKILYRVDIKNNWTPINTYTNLEGEVQTYDYAKRIITPFFYRDTMYILYHKDETYSLWIPYTNNFYDEEYFGGESKIPSNTDFKSPICVLEGIIKHEYTYNEKNEELLLRLQTINQTEKTIKIGYRVDYKKIYKRWNYETKANTLDSFRKKNAINQNLFTQIQSYMQEVKATAEYGNIYENILIIDFGTIAFTIINNSTNSFDDSLSNKPGVSLYTTFVSEEEEKVFTNCKLDVLFEQVSKLTIETDAIYYKNFSFDAKSLCITIQYLAHCYKCPSNEIKLNEYAPYEANQSNETILNSTLSWILAGISIIIWMLYKCLS